MVTFLVKRYRHNIFKIQLSLIIINSYSVLFCHCLTVIMSSTLFCNSDHRLQVFSINKIVVGCNVIDLKKTINYLNACSENTVYIVCQWITSQHVYISQSDYDSRATLFANTWPF